MTVTEVFWPGIDSDITSTVQACDSCQVFQSSQQQEYFREVFVPPPPEFQYGELFSGNVDSEDFERNFLELRNTPNFTGCSPVQTSVTRSNNVRVKGKPVSECIKVPPGLNPVENVWAAMSKYMRKDHTRNRVAVVNTIANMGIPSIFSNFYCEEILFEPKGVCLLYPYSKNVMVHNILIIGQDVYQAKRIKDGKGLVLTDGKQIKERWKEYYQQLMNVENPRVELVIEAAEEGEIEEVGEMEVTTAIKRMKNGKAVGPDDIPVEAWKAMGRTAVRWLTEVFRNILETEHMPDEWRDSTLIPIFKNKGDIQYCGNYRGIKLTSHTLKMWERIIDKILRSRVGVSDQQFGFMPNRSTTDAIFALRQIMENDYGLHDGGSPEGRPVGYAVCGRCSGVREDEGGGRAEIRTLEECNGDQMNESQ
ncbi:uncharacterized protein LOC125025221 [Penaeus chinensis]|uniref:uncharacterized protein LOC125025221 n=1 Tax=Penaeus chinensis TaxID=139456 RepID=UPI001FB67A66|nr:uncharacterized protein LOC125025221 [Penaeus chinensis]